MSRDDRIEIRSVRRVHAAPGLKTETDGDRILDRRRKIAGTGGVGGRSFWRQVLDGRERLLPARPYEMPRRIPADTAHTRSLFRSRREYARVRKRVPADASREPLQSISGKSQLYSEGREFWHRKINRKFVARSSRSVTKMLIYIIWIFQVFTYRKATR